MSDGSDALTHFLATVMGQIYGLRTAGQDLVETLNLRALAGDRTAKDTLANPWNSSVSPTRRVPEIETQLDRVRGVLEEVGPKFLAAALERDRLEKQREYQLDRDRTVCGSKTFEAASSEPAYTRLLTMLRKAGVSDRDAARVSMNVVLEAGRIIKRQTEDRWCDTLVSVRELSRAGLMQHVSIPLGWSVTSGEVWYVERSGHYWHQDSEDGTFKLEAAPDPYFDAENCQTILPTPLTIDPPGLPWTWTPETDADMHPVLWDAMPDEVYYRSFIREIEEGENIALYWPCALQEGEEPLPPFATLESMLRFDADFHAAYQRADRRFRVLDGHRAGLDEKTVDDLATSEEKHDRELFEWAYPVAHEVMPDTYLWDAWRPWGTLLSALRDYLQFREFRARDCLVSAWTYYLKGRLAQSDNDLPLFVRRALFDWLMLPVPSLLAPAVRILVPRDQLTDGARAGCPQPGGT